MDPKSFTFGAVVGALLLEIGKQIIASIFKRRQDATDNKRKMLREDIEELSGLILSINENSVSYYATDFASAEARSLSTQIKARSKTAGIKLTAINTQLSGIGKPTIPTSRLFSLRNAATKYLDVKRDEPWNEDDPRLGEIHRAAHHLHMELNKARFLSV